MRARKAFARLKPWAVIGFGGYPSYPALLAALGRKGVTLIHEQNSVLGRSNRQLSIRINLQIEQQARAEQAEAAVKLYQDAEIHAEVSPFFTNMAERLGRAHIVIGRSGASTVCELAVAGKPAILIPLKIAADDHQTYNAEVLKEAKAAVVIPEDEATVERLAEEIRTMIEGAALLPMQAKAANSVARPDAAKLLADLVERTVTKVRQVAP